MREILFRGKRKDIPWKYGGFVRHEDGVCIIDPLTGIETYVDEETVGQYTGLTDKNGKKIYEGDIVLMSSYRGGKHEASVYFKGGKFAVDGSNYSFKDIRPERMEVIGNI